MHTRSLRRVRCFSLRKFDDGFLNMDCAQNVGVVVSRLNDPWVRRLSDATTPIDKARRQRLLFERVSVKTSQVEPVAPWCALALLDAIVGLARRGAEVVFLRPV